MEIERKLLDRNFYKGNNREIKYIVIHYTTSRTSAKGSAESSWEWFNSPEAQSSAHYIVDDATIIQAVEDKDSAWHCGTKGQYYCDCRNANSLGIEIASNHPDKKTKSIPAEDNGWYFTEASINNAVELTKYLMQKYNIPIDRVIMHYDVTHKWCPAPMLNEPQQWVDFKNRLVESEVVIHMSTDELKAFIEEVVSNMGKDKEISTWAVDAVERMKKAEITDGKNMGCYATREQVITMLDRYDKTPTKPIE